MSEAPPRPPDPFQVLRQTYDQATEAWSNAVEQAISTDEFAASAGKIVELYTEMQEVLRKTSEAMAEQLHIPTKDDIARVAQLVINVERKIDDVSDLADELARRPEAASPAEAIHGLAERLDRLEERVVALGPRLDGLDRLDALAARLDAFAARLDAVDRIEKRLDALSAAPAPPAAARAPESAEPATKPAPRARRARAAADASPGDATPAEEKPTRPARRRSTRTPAKEE